VASDAAPTRDDRLLVQQAQQGDASAFGSLVGLYGPKVFNLIAYMCGDRDQADDLTQEAFLKAFKSIGNYKGDASFYTWIYRIAVNTVLSQRRTDLRKSRGVEDLAATARIGSDPHTSDPLSILERAEQVDVVQRAIKELPPEAAAVVVLRDMESLPYRQIADVLGLPAGTVRSRLFRARMTLRDILKGLLGEL